MTRIVDRKTGEVHRGFVPPYSVVVPGAMPDPHGGPSLACVVIVKTVDAHLQSIYRKLSVRSRAELAVVVARSGEEVDR